VSDAANLLKYTESFETSLPIFKLRLNSNGGQIRMSESISKYEPTPIEGDILSELVCSCYSESFYARQGEFRLDKGQIASQAMRKIRDQMKQFVEKNLPMRNPKQSKLYRWMYREMPNTTEVNTGLVLLYKYMRMHADDVGCIGKDKQEHLDNIIIMLDAMRVKHEEK
jgi:hypothetical protein